MTYGPCWVTLQRALQAPLCWTFIIGSEGGQSPSHANSLYNNTAATTSLMLKIQNHWTWVIGTATSALHLECLLLTSVSGFKHWWVWTAWEEWGGGSQIRSAPRPMAGGSLINVSHSPKFANISIPIATKPHALIDPAYHADQLPRGQTLTPSHTREMNNIHGWNEEGNSRWSKYKIT